MRTPGWELTREKVFADLDIGETFLLNDCIWTKKSKRTAVGIWPACLPEWSFFKQKEIVKIA